MPEKQGLLAREAAERLAIDALSWLAADEDAFGQFLALAGLAPDSLREAAGDANFLGGVLDYITNNEPLLVAFAKEMNVKPDAVMRARYVLDGSIPG